MDKPKEYKGYNGVIELSEEGVTIKRVRSGGVVGRGLRGNKTIPYSSIAAVQFKRAGFTTGYLQLSLNGRSDSADNLFATTKDENTVIFQNWDNIKFESCKNQIEERMSNLGKTSLRTK